MIDFKKKFKEASQSERVSGAVITALVLLIAIVLNLLLYVVVETFGLRLSEKEEVDLTLSGSTDGLFAEAIAEGKKVKISFCYSERALKDMSLAEGDPGAFVYRTAKYFEERYPSFIELDFINIITHISDKTQDFVELSKYQKDMQGNETPLYKNSVIFECGDNYRVLTDTSTSVGFAQFFTLDASMNTTAYNGEEVMASMISWVLTDEHKSAYFTRYHGETADMNFSNLLASLGYYIEVIDLRREEVPSDAGLVIISNPTSDFEASREGTGIRSEIDRLNTYLDRGGNLFVSLDPYVKTLPVLEGLLKEYGISLSTTKSDNGKNIKNLVMDPSNAITTDGFTLVGELADNETADKISESVRRYTSGDVITRESAALNLEGNAIPILVSSSSATLEAGGKVVSRDGSYCISAYSEREADGVKSRVFVMPSVYIAASDALTSNEYANKDFLFALFEELFGANRAPHGCRAVIYETQNLENLTMGTARLYTALIMLVPAAIIGVGVFVIVRRKNR